MYQKNQFLLGVHGPLLVQRVTPESPPGSIDCSLTAARPNAVTPESPPGSATH
jgi:hypothetical protein